jgi:hypothetical protein
MIVIGIIIIMVVGMVIIKCPSGPLPPSRHGWDGGMSTDCTILHKNPLWPVLWFRSP